MKAAVVVEGLVKRYGGRPVVDGVSLEVPVGGVLALLGPNGAGKTTTVECVEGLRAPDAGTVRVLGHDPRRERAAVTAGLGVMLQEGGAYQAATPREMLALYARLYPRAEAVPELLARVGLAGAADARYRTLSGGQKQRLNLALALVGRPRVVCLDEPTAGMDPAARQSTWALVGALRDSGVTVVLTTHAMDEAERLADLVAVLSAGRLVALDSPASLAGAAGRDEVLVTSPATVDATALAAAVGVAVRPDGAGRWLLSGGPELLPRVTAWFAERGIPLTGVTTAPGGLEAAYLRLTGGAQASPRPGAEITAGGGRISRDPPVTGAVATPATRTGPAASGRRVPSLRAEPLGGARRVRAQAGLELRLLLRNGENLLVTLGIPVALLVFFSLVPVLPVPAGASPVGFLLPGVLTAAVMGSAMVSLAIATGFERFYLVLKRLGATPLRRGELVAAKALAVLVVVAVQVAVLAGVAAALGWRPETGAGLLPAAALLLLGVTAFAGIGLALAGRLRAVGTLAAVNALFVVLLLVSGLVFPLDRLPDGLAAAARLLPSAALGEALRALLGTAGTPGATAPALVLAGWAVAAPVVAAAVFRWE